MSEILQFSMPKRLMADMRLAISLGDVAKITELYYAMWPDELEQNQKVVLGSGDGSGQYDFPRLGEAIDGMVIAGTTVKSASGESHSMSTEGRGSGEAVRSAQTGSIGESKPLSVPDATVDTPEPREPAAREAAEKILHKELGFAFMAQNSALTVTIFEPKFRVASLHQLDKKWDVVYLMDKAWELLIKLQIDSAELRAERDKANLENAGLRLRIHRIEQHNQHFERCESAWCNSGPDSNRALEIVKGLEAAKLAAERSLLQARKLLTEQTCSIANCGHADCNKIMTFLASTSAPEGE